MRRRAERQRDTRRRIVEATVALHESVGPLATSISAIARRAGVERLTVRAHFPTLPDLFTACSGLYFTRNPAPDPDAWSAIPDPRERLTTALGEVYAYYGRNERMLSNVTRDARLAPDLVGVSYGALLERMRSALSAGWEVGPDTAPLWQAALGHALHFTTWRSLVRDHGLRDDQAVILMARLAEAALTRAAA
jgi:AcrR family transcriptional regulator